MSAKQKDCPSCGGDTPNDRTQHLIQYSLELGQDYFLCEDCGRIHYTDDNARARMKRIRAAIVAEQERVKKALERSGTTAQKIEFLLREVKTVKQFDDDGRLLIVRYPGRVRGMNAKNIARALRRGRERWEKAKADPSIDISVLPDNSKIRRRTEESWKRVSRYGFAKPLRGHAGREAAQKVHDHRKKHLQELARALHCEGWPIKEIGAVLGRCKQSVMNYLQESP